MHATATTPWPETQTTGPVIVGIDHSARAADAIALANALAPILDGPVITEAAGAEGLQSIALQEEAAAIVVASSDRSGLGRILAGGKAERLLSGASVPVAVAPVGYADREPALATIGCAFDGSDESRAAIRWAAAAAGATGATLRLVAVHEPYPPGHLATKAGLRLSSVETVIREQLEQQLAIGAAEFGHGLDIETDLRDGSAADVLVSLSSDLDLLVVGSRGFGPLRSALLGSVSSELVRSAESPVVVVPRLEAS